MKNQDQTVFYAFKGSTIMKFFLVEFMVGTGSYFAFKIISSSVLIGIIGSVACTEGIKRVPFKH